MTVQFQEGQHRQGRRPAGRDRSAAVPGAADAGRRASWRATRRCSRTRSVDLDALPDAARRRTRSPSSSSTRRRARAPVRRRRRGRPGRRSTTRGCSSRTAAITAPIGGRVGLRQVDSGQHRPRERHERPRRDHAAAADRGGVHRSPRTACRACCEAARRRDDCRSTPATASGRTSSPAGTLLTVDNQIDPTTGTVRLKAEFANDGRRALSRTSSSTRACSLEVQRGATLVPDGGDPARHRRARSCTS